MSASNKNFINLDKRSMLVNTTNNARLSLRTKHRSVFIFKLPCQPLNHGWLSTAHVLQFSLIVSSLHCKAGNHTELVLASLTRLIAVTHLVTWLLYDTRRKTEICRKKESTPTTRIAYGYIGTVSKAVSTKVGQLLFF